MKLNGTKSRRRFWRMLPGMLALACGLPLTAAGAVYTTTWKSGGSTGNWAATDAEGNLWYRFDDGWDIRREDLATGQWSSTGTKNPNAIVFANGDQTNMTVNAQGGVEHQINAIWFSNSTSRTIAPGGGAYLKLMGDGTPKIETASGSGTGTYTFTVPLLLDKTVEINPVGGNLTFNGNITNNSYWINVYGANQKTLSIGGVVSGSGGIAVKQDSIVALTNDNTFSGGIWVEKGTIQLANSTNAMGSGNMNVGTNATLDIQHGGVSLRPVPLYLYGTGTNSAWGALRKTTSSATTLRGITTIGADSRIVVTAGGLTLTTNLVIGAANTLYITNAVTVQMTGGEITGGKQSGDGAVFKTGAGTLTIRPGSTLTGTIVLAQGEIRQDTGNSSVLPAGGMLVLSNGVTYRSDGTTAREVAKATRVDGNVNLGYTGGGALTFSGNVDLNGAMRILTNLNDATISGVVSNGGLTKAGGSNLTLTAVNTITSAVINAGTLLLNCAAGNAVTGAVTIGDSSGGDLLRLLRSNQIGDSVVPVLNGTVSGDRGGFRLNGYSETIGGLSGDGFVEHNLDDTGVGSNQSVLTLNVAAGAQTYNGPIRNSGGGSTGFLTLIKSGTGTQILTSADNVYTGETTIAAGTLALSGSGYIGSTPRIFIGTNAVFDVSARTVAMTLASGQGLAVIASASASAAKIATTTGKGLTTAANSPLVFGSYASANGAPLQVTGASSLTLASGNSLVVTNTGSALGEGTYKLISIGSGNTVAVNGTAPGTVTVGGNGIAASHTATAAITGGELYLVVTPNAPAAPTGLAASDGTSTAHVALSWNDVSLETGYVIWRHTADVAGSATAIYTNAANVVTYNDTSADVSTLYYYWVSATNTGGSSAKSTSNSGYKRLAAPANVAATDGASTADVTVTWDAVTGANTYHAYRDTDSDPAGATALGAQTSGFADAPTAGQLYYYWVMASNSTTTSTSDWSTANSGYRKLAQVAGVTATENLSDKITVSWTDGTGETGYAIWRNTSNASNTAGYVATAAANATSYDDTTATAGQDYWYWVRATNNTSTSQSDWSAADYGLRLLSEPTTAASAITFSSVADTSMTVGWTRGNGDYVLVVAKQGGAPADPSDSTAYNANAAFGSGDTTAAGSYVVYKGTGVSVPVTGLSAATEYYFAVYEFNGTTSPNYRTSDEPVSNKYTLAAEPATQATSITVSGVNEVTLTGINWTDGNGAGRIVVAKAGSAVDSFPVDATAYTANATFGSGTQIGTGNYVVHAGSGPLATLSGLSRDTVYHFRVFEFNGSSATANYNTNSAAGNPASQTTMAVNPGAAASNLTLTAVGTNQFTVTWDKGTTGTNTLILVKASGIATDPSDLTTYTASTAYGSGTQIDGASVVYTSTGTNVTVTGLTPGTRYYVRAYAFNGATGAQNYRTSDEPATDGYTLMAEPSQATSIAFSALGHTNYTISFTAGGGLSRLVVAKAGSAVTFLPNDATAYAGENNNFGAGTDLGTGNILVHRGSSPFTLTGLSAETEYYIRIFEYQGTNATLNYNTNAASGNPANRYTLSVEPSTHAASLTATALSDSQVKLDWGTATGESGFIIVRKSGSAPTGTPADGTQYTQGNALGDGTVVYVAAAAGAGSVTDSYSTAAGTLYYYQIFPYKFDGTAAHATYNYRTAATIPEASATTGSSEPGASSTILSFVPASSTSATITWTNSGTADGTIILVKSNSAVSSDPSDWTNYTANATYGSGAQIGAGNYVVFAAAGKTGTVTVANLAAGSTYHVAVYPYNGTGSLLNYRTTSPATGSLTILPAPTAQSAAADGKTLIDLAWTKNAAYNVMIVYREGSASTEPTQGQAYSVGGACGSGTVIYKGSGAVLEHMVNPGVAHYYAFYSYNGDYYSAGVTASTSTTAFATGEIVETFSYTNSTALTGFGGSNGWSGTWYGDTGVFTNSDGSFSTQTNYPANTGNKLWVYPPDNTGKAVYRNLGQSYNSGRLYFGYILNYTWNGANKYEGLSFYFSNTAEKVFFGEIYGADQQLGIDSTGSATTLSAGSGNDYIIVGYYDWAAGEAKAKAYKINTASVPTTEPSSWDVTVSKASNTVGTVNAIRLAAGAGASDGTPGNTYFDEVRIATSWADLIGAVATKPLDPTSQSATADGNEMARLAWTTNADGNSVMILHKTTAISTDPTDGVGYNAGDTLGGATVIYKGSAAKLEHVVTAGTTNFYKFYSYNGANYYSTGVTATVTNGAYADYERVNPFSYTNGTALGSTTKGGQGFGANFWTVDSGTWTAQTNYSTAVNDSVPKFFNMSNYPAMAGNLVYAADPGNGQSAKAQRSLSGAISTGTVYVAFMMSYQYWGANKWAGLSLYNGATEKAFFGKGAGANYSTLGVGDGATTYWSAFDLGQFNSGNGNTGNVYLVVGKYDFSSKQLAAKAYKILDGYTFPETEPSWDVSTILGTGIDSIDRIKLNTGSTDGGATIGKVFFDEIRYATNWSGLLAVTCPSWAGSNTLNNAAWTSATNVWLGDTENFQFQSYPTGLGQSGRIEIDWARTGGFAATNSMTFWQNANNNSYWTNQVQLTTAGSITSRFVATGGGCTPAQTNNPALVVQNLNPPTNVTAARDGVNTNSQINLTWNRGVSGGEKDVLIVRQTSDSGWTAPVNGSTYNAGDPLGGGTVVYRGAGTSFSDSGLPPSTTNYYRFYSENWTYYSTNYAATNASTAGGVRTITLDGNPADWTASASAVLDDSAGSLQEFVWTDKRGDVRPENADHPNADIQEFRVFADATWVYFLVKMTNITDATKPFVAIGVDTRTNAASAGMNWLGDDSDTFIGDGYFEGGAAHFPEYQLNVHYVAAAGGTRIEMYATNASSWYAPPTGGNTNAVISATYDAIEIKVARADLNLTGTKTARFTAAAYLNTGSWNNDGNGTVHIADNTADAVDSVSIPPWGTPDNAADLSAWREDLSDADIDFWVDLNFGAASLVDNNAPSVPVLVTPTNAANTTASPNLSWQKSSDADGKVTGYLLEVSTNDQFNGVSGTENGPVDLRVHLDANTTNYLLSTSATQYWWRVRARDTAGELSAATTRYFRVVGKLDTEGPRPTLLYIGTNVAGYLAGDYDAQIAQNGPIQSVLDSEIRDTNNIFGFVLRWEDPSGVYATNRNRDTGGFAYNIVDTDGRVSPNWDLVEIDTVSGTTNDLWGVDRPFFATNTLAAGNTDVVITNYVGAAFNVSNYNPAIEYYLTVSAEDAYTTDGSWWAYGSWPSFTNSGAAEPYYSGWCADGPNTARNITTNYLIRIQVTDDDLIAPKASTNLGWANQASLVVSNASGALPYVSGAGQDVLYEATDGGILGGPLAFTFNAYDSYYEGVALGTATTFTAGSRTLTNTAFIAVNWQTNWANYSAARSVTTDTRNANTLVTWHWPALTTQDVTALWGPTSLSGAMGETNLVQLQVMDVDNDRDGDQATDLLNFGRVRLVDDDAVDPAASNLAVTGTGLAREYVLTNLVEWTFPSGSASLGATTVADNMTAGDITNGPAGTTLQGTSNLFMNAQFYKPATNRYLVFTLTPASGRTFKAESISFETRVSSANGPDTIELFGTMPGGSETLWATNTIDLFDPENPTGTNWNNYLVVSSGVNVAMSSASTGTVTFKLLARVADTNHLVSSDNANWYVDNLTVSGYILGPEGGAQITDRDLARGTAQFSLQANDLYSGLDATTGAPTGLAPRVDFWNVSSNVCPVTNAFVTNGLNGGSGALTGAAAIAISGYAPAADKRLIALGAGSGSLTYYARATVNDYDVDRAGDTRTATAGSTNTVYDNDSSRPVRGYLFGGPLGVFVDGVLTKAVSSGNNREYRINDEQLMTAAATSITLRVNLYDYSGWTEPVLSFSNATAGMIATGSWLTAVATTAVDTTNKPDAAMTWQLSKTQADTFFSTYESMTNEFRIVSVWDKDDDRQDASSNNVDNLELTNARVGYLTFIDNDVGQANVQSNWSVSRNEWRVPQIYLGLPGDAGRSNLLANADTVLADTNSGAVLASLTNRVYDSQLAGVSAGAPLSVVLPLYDTGGGGSGRTIKGVQRGTTATEASSNGGAHDITNTFLAIGTAQPSDTGNYRSDLSSSLALTRIAAQFPTSVWTYTAFAYDGVGDWLAPADTASNHVMTAGIYDADDNRPGDQRYRLAALGTLLVRDNDTVAPSAPTNIKVNGQVYAGPLDRNTAAWTNRPEFPLSFMPAVDGAKAADDLEATGIGEYRTAGDAGDIGPDTGAPLAAATEGALANYGFELTGTGWVLDANCSYVTTPVKEGQYSLRQNDTGVAYQTNRFVNPSGNAPEVQVSGWYQSTAGATFKIEGFATNDLVTPVATLATNLPAAADWTRFSLGQRILIDFGGSNGFETASPDLNGNHWNNATNENVGFTLANLITTTGAGTSIAVSNRNTFGRNGGSFGGLLAPSAGLLGIFAISNATEDYWFVASNNAPNGISFDLTGLTPGAGYNLRLFGTRETTTARTTEYTVTGANTQTVTLATSGTDIGDGGYDGNNNTIASVLGAVADAGGKINVKIKALNDIGYLGILEIEQAINTAVGDSTVEVLKVSLIDGGGNTTYWDDIQMAVALVASNGVPTNEVSTLFTATQQGLVTNYLFAVDRDNNRPGDRKASSGNAFGTAYDITPPTAVTNLDAATDNVDDPTTQFDLQWSSTNVGPDDETHPNHPNGNPAYRDIYSPWRSYKIYYGTYDALAVPPSDPGRGSTNAYIYTNFIRNGAYTNWTAVTSTNSIADPSASGTNYLAITNLAQASIRLYDLEFDQDYAVVIVGLDKAGNEGPATAASWATNNTIKFAVTQGVLRARAVVESAFPTNNNLRAEDRSAAALYWIAAGQTTNSQAVTKDYDLIYWDDGSFDESSNTIWSLVGTIRTNWFTDAPGQDLGLAGDRGAMRFYRASYKDRWQRTNVVTGLPQRPIASEDVYALHNVILSEGNNFVALHGQPYTNTFLGVFGNDTNIWPAGASAAAGATKVEFYTAGSNAVVSSVYFFGTDANWYLSGSGSPVTTTLQTNGFFTRGFSITLPTNLLGRGYATTNAWDFDRDVAVDALVWHPVLKVPTNGPGGGSYTYTISCGKRGRTINDPPVRVYNMVALNLPVAAHPSELGFPTNFTKDTANFADEIYTWDTTQKKVRDGSTIYQDASGVWRFVTGNGAVPWDYFKPNDVLVIVSKNGGLGNTWTWTYHPTNFYTLPTRWMGE